MNKYLIIGLAIGMALALLTDLAFGAETLTLQFIAGTWDD